MAIVEGTAYWASITRPNEKFEPMWRVDLSVSDKDAEEFKSKGVNIKESVVDDKTIKNMITFKRKVSKANGNNSSCQFVLSGSIWQQVFLPSSCQFTGWYLLY